MNARRPHGTRASQSIRVRGRSLRWRKMISSIGMRRMPTSRVAVASPPTTPAPSHCPCSANNVAASASARKSASLSGSERK